MHEPKHEPMRRPLSEPRDKPTSAVTLVRLLVRLLVRSWVPWFAHLFVAGALALPASPGFAQSCRVLDPELQGAYEGGCRDGLADGQGVARGMAEYRGAFRAGKKHGQGVKTWPWGDEYRGEFADDRKQGQGLYAWSSQGAWAGESYRGGFAADRREGEGTYTWADGSRYQGGWASDWPLDAIEPGLLARLQAQARADTEARVAIAQMGARVCRALPVGISEREWVRGRVERVLGDAILVSITESGNIPLTLNHVAVAPGASIWDTASASWQLCP